MPKPLVLIILFLLSEIVIAFLFAAIAQILHQKKGFNFTSIIKGIIERLFLVIALVNGYSQAITFFSALKLATRLKHTEPAETENRFNDYYLIGNLASVAIAIGYVYIYQNFDTITIFQKLTNQ